MKHIYTLFILLLVTFSGKAEEISSAIIQPLDNSRYHGANSTFVVDVTAIDTDTVVISQDGNRTATIKIKEPKKIYCKTIQLDVGQNIIAVKFYKNSQLIDTRKRDLYFLSELFEGADEDDAENYDLNFYHKDKNEQLCKACHTLKSNVPTDGNAFEDVTKTNCYECHKDMLNKKNTHAPVANWLCIECHNGEVSEYNLENKGASKYLAPSPITNTCGICHDQIEAWELKKYSHGPVNDGHCVRCHDPHGSDNEFFLRKPIWYLCTTCHAEKASGKHVVSSFVFGRNQGAHPTKDRKDPARPGREFQCSSCHNPHGSSGVKLLRMKGSSPYGVCRRCHKK